MYDTSMGKGSGTCARPALSMATASPGADGERMPYTAIAEHLRPSEAPVRLAEPDEEEWNHRHGLRDGRWSVRPWTGLDVWEKQGNFGIFHDGEEVGYLERRIRTDEHGRLYVPPGLFRLWPEHQGGGFGGEYMRMTEEYYREIGVHRFEITAIDVGSYAWARAGYLWDVARHRENGRFSPTQSPLPDRLTRRRLEILSAEVMRDMPMISNVHLLDVLVVEGRVSRATLDEFESRLDPRRATAFSTPAELAGFGEDEPWRDEHGRSTWLGKTFLAYRHHHHLHDRLEYLNYWPGVKFFGDAVQ